MIQNITKITLFAPYLRYKTLHLSEAYSDTY